MDKNKIMEELNDIFCDIFDDADLVINETTSSDDIEDWDSLENINLILNIEKRYKIKFTIQDISSMKNVGDIVAAISERVE